MDVTVRYFASLREVLGASEQLHDLPAGMTLAALRDRLMASSERHAQALARHRAVRCAMNQTMCDEGTVLLAGAEVAFFPPVTGG